MTCDGGEPHGVARPVLFSVLSVHVLSAGVIVSLRLVRQRASADGLQAAMRSLELSIPQAFALDLCCLIVRFVRRVISADQLIS